MDRRPPSPEKMIPPLADLLSQVILEGIFFNCYQLLSLNYDSVISVMNEDSILRHSRKMADWLLLIILISIGPVAVKCDTCDNSWNNNACDSGDDCYSDSDVSLQVLAKDFLSSA